MNTNKQIQRVEFLKETVIQEYINNIDVTVRELSKKYKCGTNTLINILKSLDIPIRNRYHDIKLNYYFDIINSEEAAYWFGFLYADGSVSYIKDALKPSYRLELGLCIRDLEHVEKFKKFIGTNLDIKYRESTNSCRLIVSSKIVCKNLYKLGLKNKKTYTNNIEEIIKNIPKHYYKDFLRGYTDGDGSIFKEGTVAYSSYYIETLETLIKNLPFHIEYKIYITDNKSSRLCITKKKYFLKLLNYLYKDSKVYLERKYKRYFAVLERNF